jgi:hypothetical protein
MDTVGKLHASWGPREKPPPKIQYIPPDEDPEDLDDHELEVADLVAETWRDTPGDKRGLVLWKISNEHGVDHHKVARHLSWRRARQLYKRR